MPADATSLRICERRSCALTWSCRTGRFSSDNDREVGEVVGEAGCSRPRPRQFCCDPSEQRSLMLHGRIAQQGRESRSDGEVAMGGGGEEVRRMSEAEASRGRGKREKLLQLLYSIRRRQGGIGELGNELGPRWAWSGQCVATMVDVVWEEESLGRSTTILGPDQAAVAWYRRAGRRLIMKASRLEENGVWGREALALGGRRGSVELKRPVLRAGYCVQSIQDEWPRGRVAGWSGGSAWGVEGTWDA